VGENLTRIFRAVNSDSQIPEFLVWLHRQVSPKSTFCNNRIWIHVPHSAANNGRWTIAFIFTCKMWTYGFTDSLPGLLKHMTVPTSEMRFLQLQLWSISQDFGMRTILFLKCLVVTRALTQTNICLMPGNGKYMSSIDNSFLNS
jgi:hypothetical protein